MSDKFSYSSNEESFNGEFDTREAAIEEAKAEELTRFWTGKNRRPDPLLYIHGYDIIETIANQDDFGIDQAADWPGSTSEQDAELTEALRAAFDTWMKKYKLKPTFWLVEDVQEHKIEERKG